MSANRKNKREKWTAHAMSPVKDAGVIVAWPLRAFRDLRLLKLDTCTARLPRHMAVGDRREGEEGDEEEEVEFGETGEEEEYELEEDEDE